MRSLHFSLLFLFVFQLQISASISTKFEEPNLSIPAPVGYSPQSFCQQADGSFPFTLADLEVFNTTGYTEIFWFADANQNTALPMSANVEDGITYFAFQAIGADALYLEVLIEMTPYMPAPTGDSEQYFCYEHLTKLRY